MNQPGLVSAACKEIVEYTQNRNAVLIFASSVAHGHRVVRTLYEQYGIECGFVTGGTPPRERDELLARFRGDPSGLLIEPEPLKYLCNVNVLTTGFDAPRTDCVVMLRPTMSPGLLYQCVGRGFRLHASKQNCLILDFGGNLLRHGPIDQLRIRNRIGDEAGVAPAKECPDCHTVVAIKDSICPDCGHVFPPPARKSHEAKASNRGVLSGEVTEETFEVLDTAYRVHHKNGADDDAPRSMRVEYHVAYNRWYSEFICVEHSGFARAKAVAWWRARSPDPVPSTAEQAVAIAMAGGLAIATTITVRSVAGEKYDRIARHTLGDLPEAVEHTDASSNSLEDDDLPF
jgi:DNA repair protein RadD